MQRVEKLIIKAKKHASKRCERIILAFISNTKRGYKTNCIINKGNLETMQRNIEKIFDNKENAISFINDIANKYPNVYEDVLIINFMKVVETNGKDKTKNSEFY